MRKKYKLTKDTRKINLLTRGRITGSKILHRVKYSDGTLGGWIEGYHNLSQEGTCRVLENAWVAENAKVYGNAQVSGDAKVYGEAQVYGDAKVYGEAKVAESAKVYGNAQIYGEAKVYGEGKVYDFEHVHGGNVTYDIVPERKAQKLAEDRRIKEEQKLEAARRLTQARERAEKQRLEAARKIAQDRKRAEEQKLEAARRFTEEAKKSKERQEIMEEILLMIKHCPPGQKDQLMPRIASLLLAVDKSDRDKVVELYAKWYDKDRVGFAPSPSGIKEEIRRIAGESNSQIDRTPSYPNSGGGYGGSSSSGPAYSATEDFNRLRRFEQNRDLGRAINPDSGYNGTGEWGD